VPAVEKTHDVWITLKVHEVVAITEAARAERQILGMKYRHSRIQDLHQATLLLNQLDFQIKRGRSPSLPAPCVG
jgi:hypothetical protein